MGWLEIFESVADLKTENDTIHFSSVLIVDDEENITDTIARFLRFENYNVYTAGTAIEAMEIFKVKRPRIIVTDLQMPGMHGIEFIKAIRKVDDECAILVLSGHGDMDTVIEALKNHAADYLVKPVDLTVLRLAIEKSEKYLKMKDDLREYTRKMERLYGEVKHSREYLKSILESSPNATITYDLKGTITSWNAAAEKICGYSAEEAMGHPLKEIFVFDGPLIDDNYQETGGKSTPSIVSQILTKEKRMRYINRNANALYGDDNKFSGAIESFYDVTERTRNDRLLEKRFLQVQIINEIGKKVAGSTGIKKLVNFLSDRLVTSFFESALIYVFMYDEQNAHLVLQSVAGIAADKIKQKHKPGSCFNLDEDIFGEGFTSGKSQLISDLSIHGKSRSGVSGNAKSAFAFPIISAGKVYGVLYIENAEAMTLDEADIFMLETVVEYLAINMDRLELLEKITNQNQLLEEQAADLKKALGKVEAQNEIIEKQNANMIKDLKKAGDLQKSLLPEVIPECAHCSFAASFTPSSQLGGDYYDIFRINERYIGVLMADATGHGVSSAMLTAMFKMSSGKYLYGSISPGEVFRKLNEDFCEALQTGDFFTAFYVIIDVQEGKIIYSNGAHPLPLLYEYKSGKITELDSEGFLLGVMSDGIDYEEKILELRGKYRLFIFTDGLVEAVDPNLKQYGEVKVSSLVSDYADKNQETFLQTVVTSLSEYTQTETFEDDLTLVVIDMKF